MAKIEKWIAAHGTRYGEIVLACTRCKQAELVSMKHACDLVNEIITFNESHKNCKEVAR